MKGLLKTSKGSDIQTSPPEVVFYHTHGIILL